MRTLRQVVDDIEVDLKQTYDDRTIGKTQIAFWTLMVGDRLKSQHISKRRSGAFLHTFSNVPIQVYQNNEDPNKHKNRKFIILPKNIYDYDRDAGIEYISYNDCDEDCKNSAPLFTEVRFTRTSPAEAKRLYMDKYEKPDRSNPYFYRVRDHIYFLGIECVEVSCIEIGLYATFDPVTKIELDEPFDFPQELDYVLKKQVLDMGRWILMIPEERINDSISDQNPNQVPTNKLVSVNDPINSDEGNVNKRN